MLIEDLSKLNYMYQYSLAFFIKLFKGAIQTAQSSNVLDERLTSLNDELLDVVYRQVCMSLFERDKPVFSFMLCLKLLEHEGKLDQSELFFLITGGNECEDVPDIPADWITSKMWVELNRLD